MGSLPVAPVRVTWRLTSLAGGIVAKNTAADFRYGEPFRRRDFCTVYAPGTRQNFAAVGGTFHWGEAGVYLFDLTPRLINTSRLPQGRYRITVTASDSGGNKGRRTEVIEVRRDRSETSAGSTLDTRCAAPVTRRG